MLICPCCGGPMADAVPVEDLLHMSVPQQQMRIIKALADAYPRAVSKSQLIDAIYWDDPDGGPDNPSNVINQQLCRLRPLVSMHGWTIPMARGGAGNYGLYRLLPMGRANA